MPEHKGFPVLLQHDATRVIGRYNASTSELVLHPRTVTVDQLLNAGFGLRVLEEEWYNSVRYARRVQIVELSV